MSTQEQARAFFSRLAKLGPGYVAEWQGVRVSIGPTSGRPRWWCTCGVSGSVVGTELEAMVLPRFVHRHVRCR